MKTLIVDDDSTCQLLLQEILKNYGQCHVAVNGREAVEAVRVALEAAKEVHPPHGAKVVMTTALADRANVMEAIQGRCDYFLVKPIEKAKLLQELRELALIA